MDETIKFGDEDVRRYDVKDKVGNGIGKVHVLLIDPQGNTVRFLVVESDRFLRMGETKSFIPVDAITRITKGEVRIDQPRERMAGTPPYDPELVTTRAYHENSYGYYGYYGFARTGWVATRTPASPSIFWGRTAGLNHTPDRTRHHGGTHHCRTWQ